MRKIEYVVNCITRSLTNVENDRLTPATIAPETKRYVQDLLAKYPNDNSEFADFIAFLPFHSLRDELLGQILPVALRNTILTLRREHEELQNNLVTEIANHDFSNARKYLDRQRKSATISRRTILKRASLLQCTLSLKKLLALVQRSIRNEKNRAPSVLRQTSGSNSLMILKLIATSALAGC